MTHQAYKMDVADLELLESSLSDALRLRQVGHILDQLDRRELLAEGAERPETWSAQHQVDAYEFTQWLSRHLNVSGWRELLNAVQHHNKVYPERPWDQSWPGDMLAALDEVIAVVPAVSQQSPTEPAAKAAHSTEQPVTMVAEPSVPYAAASMASVMPPDAPRHIVSSIESHDHNMKMLGHMLAAKLDDDEARPPTLAWLLAPGAAAAVVKARAISARAFAELQRARSETMLHALHALENDTRSTAVLGQIEDLRHRLGPRLRTYCREHHIPVPEPDTEQEANLLFLLNAQLIALDDAQDEIARRGADLAREKIRLAEKTARLTVAASTLPAQLEGESKANPMRERLIAEQMRHKSASLMARVIGAVGGGLTGLVTAATDVLVTSIAETAVLTGPPLVVLVLTLVAETLGHQGTLTLHQLLGFVGTALWNSLLVLGLTLTGYAGWRYLEKKTDEKHNRVRRQHPPRQTPRRPANDAQRQTQGL